MKNIKLLITVFTIAFTFFACSEEEAGPQLIEANHRAVVTSEMNYENTINPGGHIDFGDISRGVKSRTWTFPEGADVATIAGEESNTSSKEIVKGFFYKPGVYDVVLSQIFNGIVYPNEDSQDPIQSTSLDTTIVVTVLDNISSTLEAYYINDDGSTGAALNMSNNAENEITASKYVRLNYTSNGAPRDIVWNLAGGKPTQIMNPGGEADVRYSKLGTHDLQFIASRSRPFDADTISIKNFIKVIPSTDPVDLDRVFEKGGKIALEFSREMDEVSLNKNAFTVRIENGGTTINPVLRSATIDPDEGNIVLLELDNETLYNNDKVFVSYTPGILRTLDLVDATAFTDAELGEFTNVVNLYPSTAYDYSIENSTSANWTYLWWGGIWGEYDLDVSFSFARTGDRSLSIEYRPNGGMIIDHKDDTGTSVNFTLESGKSYEFGYWLYVETLGFNNSGNSPDIRFYPSNWAFELIPTTFTADFPTGKWVYQKQIFTAGFTGDVTWLIRGYNEFNSEAIKFYIDDIVLGEIQLRP